MTDQGHQTQCGRSQKLGGTRGPGEKQEDRRNTEPGRDLLQARPGQGHGSHLQEGSQLQATQTPHSVSRGHRPSC